MTHYLLLALSVLSLLMGCHPKVPDDMDVVSRKEQFYIDARHKFTINHPQNWQKVFIPVSSTEYREDTVIWTQMNQGTEVLRFTITTQDKKNYKDLASFSQSMLQSMGYLTSKENPTPLKVDIIEGKISSPDRSIIYSNQQREEHYYHCVLSSNTTISSTTNKIFQEICNNLQEIPSK